jgi:hypothetical protein
MYVRVEMGLGADNMLSIEDGMGGDNVYYMCCV